MTNVIPIAAARPSPVQLRRYSEALARALLLSAGISTHSRTVTAAFRPSARTNVDAVSDWIYRSIIDLSHLRSQTLETDSLLRAKLRIVFFELLARTFYPSPFD